MRAKYLVILIVLFQSCRFAEDEHFYIPESFEGTVVIFFDQTDGQDEEYSNDGGRIYRIPKNGILFTEFSANYGAVNAKYYYVNEFGRVTKEIRPVYRHDGIENYSDEIVAYNPQTIAKTTNYNEHNEVVSISPPGLSILVCPMNKVINLSEKRFDAIRDARSKLDR
ncbi:DUF6843 domain-containing protein [Ekhidna sp.]|uniref:DUF6843 domain-containing protein n=1 Tax=Ekhidna sp. TaxID=2608089 RepID=UPI003B5BBE1B